MSERKLAYLCLQATTEGQASHAHVHEIMDGLEALGWSVNLFQPAYAGSEGPGPLGRLIEFSRVKRRLLSALETGGYDALYVRGHALAWPASRAAQRMGIPVVQECNGPLSDFFTVWPAARLVAPLLALWTHDQFRRADAVIAVTDELAAWLTSTTGASVTVIGNGANERAFFPGARTDISSSLPQPYAILFGALSPWQGIEVALGAASDAGWPEGISLVIVGDGVMRGSVERAVAHGSPVVYTGPVPYSEVPGAVAGSLCSLVLSHRAQGMTGSPLKMYESMACGVPVVGANAPVTADTLRRHECGIVVELAPAEVADAVARLASDPELAARLGGNGRAAVEAHYSWSARAAATDAVIAAVLREPQDG